MGRIVTSAILLRLRHKSEEQEENTPFKPLAQVALCKTFKIKVSCKDKTSLVNEKNIKNQDTEKFDDPISWNDVSYVIDFAMFLIYVSVYCISTVTIMTILKNL